ncbi:hypothetical protein K8942_01340 [Candidatus Peribacteria bacterium]|nr:MAG: hypothetical protein K8942_01340 [Candidatus Peribacteria bacterium]
MAEKERAKELGGITVDVAEPRRFFCDRAFVLNNDEHFVLALQTGSVIDAQYAFTPKHMKRLLLRIKEKLDAYEAQNGILDVTLPSDEV